jgi:hypothetical protein
MDIIFVIIILYLWHLVICEHFWSVCVWNKWSWAHVQWVHSFGLKIGYDIAQVFDILDLKDEKKHIIVPGKQWVVIVDNVEDEEE